MQIIDCSIYIKLFYIISSLNCKAVTVVEYLHTNGIHYFVGVLVWHR